MTNFNDNLKYWEKRYSDMDAKNVVGHCKWNNEKYIAETLRFERNIIDVMKAIDKNFRYDSVLDFGCGKSFRFMDFCMKNFNKYYSCDILDFPKPNEEIINKFNQNKEFYFSIISNNKIPSFKNKKFDLIFSCVTLQHIIDEELLKHYIENFHQRLKKNGYVIITENTSNNKSSNYLTFRNIEKYKTLFTENDKFEVVNSESFISSNEEHTSILFKKKI